MLSYITTIRLAYIKKGWYNMLEQFLQELQNSNPILQFIGVAIVAMIPFMEGYFAVPVGIAIGFSPLMTIVAAIFGNWISVMVRSEERRVGKECRYRWSVCG